MGRCWLGFFLSEQRHGASLEAAGPVFVVRFADLSLQRCVRSAFEQSFLDTLQP